MTRTLRRERLINVYKDAVRAAKSAAPERYGWSAVAEELGSATVKQIKTSASAQISGLTDAGIRSDIALITEIANLTDPKAPQQPDRETRLKEALGRLADGHIGKAV